MMGLTPMQQYVHKLESVLKQVADGTLSLTTNLFESFYSAINVLRESLEKLAKNPDEPLDYIDELTVLECLISGGKENGNGIYYPRKNKENYGNITQQSNTLKVNFEKLDDLLNLVGELVIHKTALLALETKLKETVKDRSIIEAFTESSQLIGKSAAELREAIMKARMLPVKVVFQRFSRLVRDLSISHGKEINLEFEGEETELDKTVIDEIGEPLLHLIRNAVDHGIEKPAARRKQNKPAAGTIRLSARHESSHIIIAVQDDGQGIDADKIRHQAVAKGLLDSEQVRAMDDYDAKQLLFLPGFSTSKEVTETSGRGIGLDSRPGRGTTFTLKLPLTLAIINALMVEVAGETFAIPLSGVLESIKVATHDIHQVADGEIIQLRERLLPIIRLDRFFGLGRIRSETQEYVVVVGSGEKRGGLVVDRLIGQQEVVIKGMDEYLGELPGISGGTVLGDGRVALILDIAALIVKTRRGGTHAGE
jgi:two-component system chemotaxis sensor kinase CheA